MLFFSMIVSYKLIFVPISYISTLQTIPLQIAFLSEIQLVLKALSSIFIKYINYVHIFPQSLLMKKFENFNLMQCFSFNVSICKINGYFIINYMQSTFM